MSRVLVTGGTGELGSALVPLLLKDGHTVRISSRSPRKAGYDPIIEWAQTNFENGTGFAEAVKDVDIIIHCASSSFKPQAVDIDGTAKLLQVAEKADIKHFIYISIVGIEKIPFAYYKAKVKAEQIIEATNVPYTILRATQFHSLMERMFLLPVVKMPLIGFLPKNFKFQLLDDQEAAQRLAELANEPPAGMVADIGGPEVLTLNEIAQKWLSATGKKRLLINLPLWGKTADGFRKGYTNTPENCYGKITWDEWLARTYGDKNANQPESIVKATQGSS